MTTSMFIICLLLQTIYMKCQETLPIDSSPPPCDFTGTLSSSIETPWAAKCFQLVGDIVIDSTTNLTEAQLGTLFQNITSIQGSFVVENTQLKQLLFLKTIKILLKGWSDNILQINRNPLLTQIHLENLNRSDGVVVVKDNPQLDMTKYCRLFEEVLIGNRVISRNKADCGYQLEFPLTFTSILNVPANLSVIYGDIFFEDTAISPERLSILRSVRKLYGCLTVYTTNFETLSFLENLEEIVCQSSTKSAISIKGNSYLENLGLRKLTKVITQKELDVINNRILILSFDEAEVFMPTTIAGDRVEGRFPTEDLPPNICTFNSVKDDIAALNENCTSIVGLLYYEGRSFSVSEVQKFQQIRKIYGNIEFVEMNIEDLSMFSSLEKIISFNATFPAIQLTSMTNLISVDLPRLQTLYSPISYKFSIDNCPKVNLTLADCRHFEEIIREPLFIDWMECGSWYEAKINPL